MKHLLLPFLVAGVLLALVCITRPVSLPPSVALSETPEGAAEDHPDHPGWYEQWYRMRQNEAGIVPPDYLRNVYLQESQRWGQGKTTAGLLSNVSSLGPVNVGGRTRALIVDVANHDHLIAGGISGGIWRSTDRGVSWSTVDDQAQSLAVTHLSQDLNQPNEIYYTTGEVRGNSAGISGAGVFKSTDGGSSFNLLPATTGSNFSSTWRVQVSPVEPGRVYVATRNGGLQLSTDGGSGFSMAFGITNGMEVSDVEVFPDSSVLIGVRTQGVFYSPNGNPGTFVQITNGLPANGFRRVELAYCDSFPNVVYAVFEDDNGSNALGCWRSGDQGQTWTATANPESTINFSFPWYCLLLAVQPNDSNFVIAAGQQIAHSADGGNNWSTSASSHADYHSATFDRDNPVLVYIGNDGGIWKYSTPFMNGSPQDLNDGYTTTQFYAGAYFPQDDVMGGTQDNGTHVSRSGSAAFDKLVGGDGAYCAVNQQNPSIAYASTQNGQIRRSTNAQATNPNFSLVTNQLDNDNNGSIDEGAWFINPFDINLEDGNQLYFVTQQRAWRSTDGASNWEPMTNDLRSGNSNPYCVGISRDANPTVYVGGESAILYRTDLAGTALPGNEANLSGTVPGGVSGHFISCIQVHPTDPTTIFVTFSTVSSQPRIFRVTNAHTAGPTWTSVSGDLPASLPVNWLALHPLSPDSAMLAATDYGLYSTTNGGVTWTFETDVPNVPVFQVKIRDGDHKVFAFTHGRGIWTADFPVLVSREPEPELSLKLHPVPTGNLLRVEYPGSGVEGAQYVIRDIRGIARSSGPLGTGALDVSALAAGVYFFCLRDGERERSVRFVKQ